MKIKLNDIFYETGVAIDGNTLSLGIVGAVDVASIYTTFTPNNTPIVSLYDDEEVLTAIYSNHRVISVNWNENVVQVNLIVDPLEVSAADAINERIARQNESAAVSDDAIAELAELLASIDERLATIEEYLFGGDEEDPTDQPTDESTDEPTDNPSDESEPSPSDDPSNEPTGESSDEPADETDPIEEPEEDENNG